MNIGEIRDVASKKLYPEISAIKGRKTLKIIRALAAKALKEEKKDICDVTAIPETTYQNIPYFNIDEYIAQQLPPCIYMELQAGKYGNTAIFNTKEYNYHGDGVASITNAINHARTIKEIVISDSGEAPEYQGSIQTRPGKKNDGSAENYYLSMLLHIDKVPQSDQPEDIIIPKKKKSKAITQKLKKVKKLQTARQKAHEEAKNLEKAPSPIKDLRKKIALKLANAKITAEQLRDTFKGKKALVGVLDAYKKNFIEQGKKLLKNEKKQGNINHRQYTELLSKIERAFDKKDTFATNKRGKNKGKG